MADKVTQTVYQYCGIIADDANSDAGKRFGVEDLASVICGLEEAKLVEFANRAFLELALKKGIDSNPANFAELSVHAMKILQENNKNNLVYKFVQCIATNRPACNESLFPLEGMPFGLVEYQIEFFSATNVMQVGLCPLVKTGMLQWYTEIYEILMHRNSFYSL